MKLLGMIALAGAALLQGDALERSWNSKHWAVVGVYGEGEKRLAVVVDRESIVKGPAANRRAFNMIFVLAGRPPRTGMVSSNWIDCDTLIGENDSSSYYDAGRVITNDPPQKLTLKPGDSEIYRTVKAVCGDDWTGMTLLDAPGDELSTRAFEK